MKLITFSTEQRQELAKLKVTGEQLESLASMIEVLGPLFRVEAPPKMSDVRDKVKALQAALEEAHQLVNSVLNVATPPLVAARCLLGGKLAFTDTGELEPAGITTMNQLLAALTDAKNLVDKAVKQLPTKQSRGVTLPQFSVQWIDTALINGWNRSQALIGNSFDAESNQWLANATAYPFKPSSYWDSPFFKVVQTCFRAMSGAEGDRGERAIKDYIKKLNRGFVPSVDGNVISIEVVFADKSGRQMKI